MRVLIIVIAVFVLGVFKLIYYSHFARQILIFIFVIRLFN